MSFNPDDPMHRGNMEPRIFNGCTRNWVTRLPCGHTDHNEGPKISCLEPLEGVTDALIADQAGLILASNFREDVDATTLAVWALGVHKGNLNVAKKLGQNRVHQIMLRSAKGLTIIADHGSHFIVITSNADTHDAIVDTSRSLYACIVQKSLHRGRHLSMDRYRTASV